VSLVRRDGGVTELQFTALKNLDADPASATEIILKLAVESLSAQSKIRMKEVLKSAWG
jgi:hypothetical protein